MADLVKALEAHSNKKKLKPRITIPIDEFEKLKNSKYGDQVSFTVKGTVVAFHTPIEYGPGDKETPGIPEYTIAIDEITNSEEEKKPTEVPVQTPKGQPKPNENIMGAMSKVYKFFEGMS